MNWAAVRTPCRRARADWRPKTTAALALALTLIAASLPVAAQASKSSAGIYTCTDDKGRRLTSDRPIADCVHKEQQLLNRDGSLRQVVPPTLTSDERAEKEARERKAAEDRVTQQDAIRRDRNLLMRFPNEATHQKAREAALDPVRLAIKATEIRLRDLTVERKPLLDEAEFYLGKPLPLKLKHQIDANDAALDAQRTAAANQGAELDRINALYDAELERLRKLWSGALPGSLGPLPTTPPPARAAQRTGAATSGASSTPSASTASPH
jgi:hypothetical protein